MYSWLSAYEESKCATEPTWSKLLSALRLESVDLTELATDIESCLKKAPGSAISQAEEKEGGYIGIVQS